MEFKSFLSSVSKSTIVVPMLALVLMSCEAPSGGGSRSSVSVSDFPATRCDQIAAHPDDPQKSREVRGVSDADIEPQSAAESCLATLEIAPAESRILFQLGRALMLGGETELAAEFLQDAAGLNHGAAFAYLGDYQPDATKANEMYSTAATMGFAPAAQLVQTIKLADGGSAQECDRLATHINDPQKTIRGILDVELEPQNAIPACLDAVSFQPDIARLRFQLGRSLYIGGLAAEAKEQFEISSNMGSVAALGYLADYEDDDARAIAMLQKSAAGGFWPSQKILDEISYAQNAQPVQPTQPNISLQPSQVKPLMEDSIRTLTNILKGPI